MICIASYELHGDIALLRDIVQEQREAKVANEHCSHFNCYLAPAN